LARRARASRTRRRPARRRAVLAAGALLGGAAWVLSWLASPGDWLDRQFPIAEVAVTGETRQVSPQALAATIRRTLEGGFFTADLPALREAVEGHPWIRSARLNRRWPVRLEVHVSEHRARARWQGAEAVQLVNRRGRRFKAWQAGDPADVPLLVGPGDRLPALLERLQRLEARLQPKYPVTRLSVDARGAWSAEVAGRVTIRFGRHHWQRRLARLLRVDRGWGLLERGVHRVDLRYPDGLAVAVAETKTTDPEPGRGNSDPANRL